MAQVQSPTNALYAAISNHLTNQTTPDTMAYIALDTGNMGSLNAASNAPVSECSGSGLTRAASTMSVGTVTVTGDKAVAAKTFTAGADAAITGHWVMSASSSGNALMWVAYAATINLQGATGDTLATTSSIQSKLGT